MQRQGGKSSIRVSDRSDGLNSGLLCSGSDSAFVMYLRTHLTTGLTGLWVFGATTGVAWPQAAPSLGVQSPVQQPLPPQAAPQQIEPPPRQENPGLINEIGKLFEKSKS